MQLQTEECNFSTDDHKNCVKSKRAAKMLLLHPKLNIPSLSETQSKICLTPFFLISK